MMKSWIGPDSKSGLLQLESQQTLQDLQELADISGYPQITCHTRVAGRQILHPLSQGNQHSAPTKPVLSSDVVRNPFAIGSITKHLTSILCIVVFERGLIQAAGRKIHITDKAIEIFNICRAAHSMMPMEYPDDRNPSFQDLLLHCDAFPPTDASFITPDESFIGSADQFIDVVPRLTNAYFQEHGSVTYIYANTNYIFLGIFLETYFRRSLHEVMWEHLLEPLNMLNTELDFRLRDSPESNEAITMPGHRISANVQVSQQPVQGGIQESSIQTAALGARSCVEDLDKLYTALFAARKGSSGYFVKREADMFFSARQSGVEDAQASFAGTFTSLDSETAGKQALTWDLLPSDFPQDRLGTWHDRSLFFYYKGAVVDGFTGTVYLSPYHETIIIVLGNATGPIDVTEHIARYILQTIFELQPKVRFRNVVQRQLDVARRVLGDIEHSDLDSHGWLSDFSGLTGRYRNETDRRVLEINVDGEATLTGDAGRSSLMECRRQAGILRLFPGKRGFGPDRWTIWIDLTFGIDIRGNGMVFLHHKKQVWRRLGQDV